MPSISTPSWINSVRFAHMHTVMSLTDPHLRAVLHSYTWVPKESTLLYVLIHPWPWRNSKELCEAETEPELPVARAPCLPGLDWVGSLQDSLSNIPRSTWGESARAKDGPPVDDGMRPLTLSRFRSAPPRGGARPSRAQPCHAAVVMENAITAPEGGSHV